MMVHHRHASETAFKWRFANGPMLVFLSIFFKIISPLIDLKHVVNVAPPLKKLPRIFNYYINGDEDGTPLGAFNKQQT